MKPTLLACPPVARARQKELGIAGFSPGPDQSKTDCEICGIKVWIGPRLLRARKELSSAKVVCFKCALKQPGGHLQHLAGKGGSYLVNRKLFTRD